MHKPIIIKNISFSVPSRICFQNFSTIINSGDRIGIIGDNGSGKSTLLKCLAKLENPTSGSILTPSNLRIGYLNQIINNFASSSGGERLNKALTKIFSEHPSILLLDEPTNHLDECNRSSLIKMLQGLSETLVIVTHDTELLQSCTNILWHIDKEEILVFKGKYDSLAVELKQKQQKLERQLCENFQNQKKMHQKLMKEQLRAKKSKNYGKKKFAGDKLSLNAAAQRGEITLNKNSQRLQNEKTMLLLELKEIKKPSARQLKFHLNFKDNKGKEILSISDGFAGYKNNPTILKRINLIVYAGDRITIHGKNGSGKTTLFKAILNDPLIEKKGEWRLPITSEIGYLDQHYQNLDEKLTIFESIAETVSWPEWEIRKHLEDFSFYKDSEIYTKVKDLSGGEKARLSLALIAAKTPTLLLLDEITNNLDIKTKLYVADVLNQYPGALILISHEKEFLAKIRNLNQSINL